MKIFRNSGLVLLFLFFLSCGQDEKRNHLSIKIDAIMQENDSIQVFYATSQSINFNEDQAFWTKVKGNKKNQIITVNFSDTIKPKQLRIDFGRNINQKEIVVNEITFSYKEESFSAKGEEIYNLFRVDDSSTAINKLTGSLNRKDSIQVNGPSLYPNGNKLYKVLNSLYSKKLQP